MRATTALTAAVGSSLKLKLILLMVAILALTIGIAPWGAIKMQERQLLEVSRERLRSLDEMLRKTIITTCILTGKQESVQEMLESVTTHPDLDAASHRDIESVRLFDTKGVIHYSSRREERGRRLSATELSRFYGKADPIIVTGSGGSMVHTLVRPLFNQHECFSCHSPAQKILGLLQVSVSIDRMERQLAGLRKSALVATLLTLGVIVIGIWLSLTFLVDQPLQQLVDVMTRAEHGDLGARAEIRNSDELGRLARHFNEMISKLDGAQQELERYHQEQLARADRLASIGEMAAAIAHEIRNPLTGISGVLSVLSRDFPDDDPRREIVRQTHLLIDRLNKTVEDLLHYSRPSLPQFQAVRLADVIGRALSLVEGEAAKARVGIVREAAPESSDDTESLTVNADPPQLQQVLINLILNAIQASPARAQIRVRTYAHKNDGGQTLACVEVEDSGKGMTPDEAVKAFHPFFSTKAQGTGLGLPIAKQIVEQHHGRIALRSTPGKGTCVRVELPARLGSGPQGA